MHLHFASHGMGLGGKFLAPCFWEPPRLLGFPQAQAKHPKNAWWTHRPRGLFKAQWIIFALACAIAALQNTGAVAASVLHCLMVVNGNECHPRGCCPPHTRPVSCMAAWHYWFNAHERVPVPLSAVNLIGALCSGLHYIKMHKYIVLHAMQHTRVSCYKTSVV
jgi:hypothetical protein